MTGDYLKVTLPITLIKIEFHLRIHIMREPKTRK